jgi:hypothetical protein
MLSDCKRKQLLYGVRHQHDQLLRIPNTTVAQKDISLLHTKGEEHHFVSVIFLPRMYRQSDEILN